MEVSAVILVLNRQKEKDNEIEVNLRYITRLYLKKEKGTKGRREGGRERKEGKVFTE